MIVRTGRRFRAALAALALALAASPALASPPGFAFLEVPAGARASALGGAYGALGEGVESIFWNPAGLAAVKGTQVTGSHYEFFEHLRHDQFALAGRPFGSGVAASVRALYSEPIEERDEIGTLIGTFGSHDLEFALGTGGVIAPGWRLGGSLQAVRERIADNAANTWSAGAGTTWDPARWPRLRLTLSAHNLGPAAHYTFDGVQGAPVSLPAAVQTGAAYAFDLSGGLTMRGALETRMTRGRSAVVMLGAEVAHPLGAAIRLGVRANDDASSFSVGAGYALQALHLDYAFVPYRLDLGDTHRLSFSAQF